MTPKNMARKATLARRNALQTRRSKQKTRRQSPALQRAEGEKVIRMYVHLLSYRDGDLAYVEGVFSTQDRAMDWIFSHPDYERLREDYTISYSRDETYVWVSHKSLGLSYTIEMKEVQS